MATTIYLINLRLEFDTKAARNTQYTALKAALVTAKQSDAWLAGAITKDEYSQIENSQETV